MKFPDDLKSALKRIEEYSDSHPDEAEDVLNDKSR